ncbi:hypothetical protein HU200_011971 [Digitaria exilis]|uniref:Uncharacterized protein n=1 Tax=Digitaria exilis TaxID=1010633 RepID=A0A835FGH7_9POAL|nr:hypothetical protein HU200_011971 [Digitaria exilis]
MLVYWIAPPGLGHVVKMRPVLNLLVK